MRIPRLWPILILPVLCVLLVGCNDGQYSNPTSPAATTTEWRTMQVDSSGASFSFPDIGALVTFPAGAVPAGESYIFRIRLFPTEVPIVPSGPVLVRMGTFELDGPPIDFAEPVEVIFRILKDKAPGEICRGYWLNDNVQWEFMQNAPVVDGTGPHCVMYVEKPGIYGAFEFIQLHVEATVSRQQGPLPLSVGFKALVSGGNPPYVVSWDFGDNNSGAGVTTSHMYVEPGVFTATVTVQDDDNNLATDWLTLTAYWMPGPPALP